MKLLVKIIAPLLVLFICVLAARAVIANRPEPGTRPQFKTVTSIDATRVDRSSYSVTLRTQGEVGAATAGSLAAEVAGSVTEVSPNFVVGGSFRKGELLVQVDPRDYEIALTLAEANFAQSRALLAEEQARSEQAAEDWRKLGRKGKPSALTLRKPQLAAARAALEGSRGQVQRAQLDLERTKITARYDGRVQTTDVALGQYVNTGAELARIFSTDTAEIRLPLTNSQLRFINLSQATDQQREVLLHSSSGGEDKEWNASLSRTEGVDPASRQLYVIAKIDKPYEQQNPLRVGQFVQASVTGKTLDNVFVIPRSSLREDRQVLLVDEFGTLQNQDVKVEWKDAEVAVISEGLNPGDVLALTSLGSVTNGTKVQATIDGVPPNREGSKRDAESTGSQQPEQPEQPEQQTSQQTEHMQRLKTLVDAGRPIPPVARQRIQARLDAGEELPDWLTKHMQQTSN